MIKINQEFKDLIPPVSEDEYLILKESIQERGQESAVIVWEETDEVVDGHHRYQVCQELGIEPKVEYKSFSSQEDVKVWMIELQLGRRNLGSFWRMELVNQLAWFKQQLKTQAKSTSSVNATKTSSKILELELSQTQRHSQSVNGQLADMANVSHESMRKHIKIMNEGDEDTKEQYKNGDISTHKAYTKTTKKEKKELTNEQKINKAISSLINQGITFEEIQKYINLNKGVE